MKMNTWTICGIVSTILLPILVSLIVLYSDVQVLKETKVNCSALTTATTKTSKEITEIRVNFTKQMTRNTMAIEGLTLVIEDMRQFLRGIKG